MKTKLCRPLKVFLERSGPRAINSERLRAPHADCSVCSIVRGGISVDLNATLQDLVEGVLQQELGYTGEMSVLTDEGVIYDPEMEDNLPKKLSELGIKGDSSLIIKDEDDEEKDPRVDLEFRVVERYVHFYAPLLDR